MTTNASNATFLSSKDSPITRDAEMYASKFGVDIDTAIHRLMIQDLIGDLDAELSANEASTYAGLWIQHIPEFRIIVQFTQGGEETIRSYNKHKLVDDLIEIKKVDFTLEELRNTRDMVYY
jgi:hypothetical protein